MGLGLGGMEDRKFDRYLVDATLERFLDRGYEHSGEGGLFTANSGRDTRHMRIWYQVNYYLREIIKEGSI